MPTDQHQLSHLAPGYWGSFYKLELDVIFLEFFGVFSGRVPVDQFTGKNVGLNADMLRFDYSSLMNFK